jgi:hypothetical protein
MSRAGFYSSNEMRSYPFVNGNGGINILPEVIVDFGCIMGHNAQFENGVHKVWLYQITKDDDLFRFEFKSDAPGLAGRSLIFDFNAADAEYTTKFSSDDIASGSSAYYSSDAGLVDEVRWEGYLVIGKVLYAAYSLTPWSGFDDKVILWRNALEGLEWRTGGFLLEEVVETTFAKTTTDETGTTIVEPALIQNLANTYVQRINLANKIRTIATPAEGCSDSITTDGSEIYFNSSFVGDVKIKSGYNVNVVVSQNDNSITFTAALGSGEGEPCVEVPVYEGEASPDSSGLLSGGPRCKDVIKSINGIGGRVVTLQGGLGTRIVSSPAGGNRITIVPDHSGMALCGYVSTSSVGG